MFHEQRKYLCFHINTYLYKIRVSLSLNSTKNISIPLPFFITIFLLHLIFPFPDFLKAFPCPFAHKVFAKCSITLYVEFLIGSPTLPPPPIFAYRVINLDKIDLLFNFSCMQILREKKKKKRKDITELTNNTFNILKRKELKRLQCRCTAWRASKISPLE